MKLVIRTIIIITTTLTITSIVGCKKSPRLMTAYCIGNNIYSRSLKENSVRFDESSILCNNLVKNFSFTQYNNLIWLAWVVEAYDALGGAPLFKIRVTPCPADAVDAITIEEGGRIFDPTLIVYQDRLICLWIQDDKIYIKSSNDGENWGLLKNCNMQSGRHLMTMNATIHNDKIHIGGITSSGDLFIGRMNVQNNNQLSWDATNIVTDPTVNPTKEEGVSIVSNGTDLFLGYGQGIYSRYAIISNGIEEWSFGFVESEPTGIYTVTNGVRPALIYFNNKLFAIYKLQDNQIYMKYRENNLWGVRFGVELQTINENVQVNANSIMVLTN